MDKKIANILIVTFGVIILLGGGYAAGFFTAKNIFQDQFAEYEVINQKKLDSLQYLADLSKEERLKEKPYEAVKADRKEKAKIIKINYQNEVKKYIALSTPDRLKYLRSWLNPSIRHDTTVLRRVSSPEL
jgi:uncharacterized protein YneF (UPF0154 family)